MDINEARKIVGQSLDALKRSKIFESLPAALEFLESEASEVKKKRDEVYDLEEQISRLQRDLASTKETVEEQKKKLTESLEVAEKRHGQLLYDGGIRHQAAMDRLRAEQADFTAKVDALKLVIDELNQQRQKEEAGLETVRKSMAKILDKGKEWLAGT